MSKNLESPGRDRETRPGPADLSDLRKRVYPTLFVRRRDPKVFPVILRMHERRPSRIRIASSNCFVSCVVSEGSSLCLRGAPLGQRLEPSLTQGASASPSHKALRRCASGEKHPVLRVGGAEGALRRCASGEKHRSSGLEVLKGRCSRHPGPQATPSKDFDKDETEVLAKIYRGCSCPSCE